MSKRIFIAFASEDEYARDFLIGQAKNHDSPFEWTDMSVKEPYEEEWREKVRSRIKGCDGVIALLSKNSLTADGQLFEISTAKDEEVPLIGVYISKEDKSKPDEMAGVKCIEWTWDGIADFVESL